MDNIVICFRAWRLFSPLLFFMLGGTVFSQEFEIELDRPERSGNSYQVALRGIREGKFVGIKGDYWLPPNWKTESKHKTVIELDALVKIVDVDAAGRVLEQTLSVERWRFDDMGEGEGLDLQGKVITVKSLDNVMVFTVDGEELGFYNNEMLRIVLRPHLGDVGTDARLGSTKRRRIGDSWPMGVNRNFLDELLPRDVPVKEAIVSKKPIEGAVTLSGVKRFRGIECLHIDAQRKGNDVLTGFLPDAVKIEASEVERSFIGFFPVRGNSRCLYSKRLDRCSIVTKITEGPLSGVQVRQRFVETAEKWVTRP